MDVKNCKMCGRLFNYMGSGKPICSACASKLEDKFFEVREYVRDHKDAGINQVAEENDVPVSQIKQWIREERLAFSDNSPVGIECENCGASIKTGRFCKACKDILASGLNNAVAKPKVILQEKKQETDKKAQVRFMDKM